MTAADAKHMPVYRDNERLYVGVDQGAKYIDTFTIQDTGSSDFSIHRIENDLAEAIPVVGERGDIEIRYSSIGDGVGQQVVSAYLEDAIGSSVQRYNYDTPAELRIIGSVTADDAARVIRAVQLVNAALPKNAKIRIGSPEPGLSLIDSVTPSGFFVRPVQGTRENTIDVEFVPANQYRRGANSAAVTWGKPVGEYAYIQFNKGANSYPRDHESVTLLAHELMHALGLYGGGHVDSKFASIMDGTNAMHLPEQHGIRKPLSILYPIDREALRILYERLEPGDGPTDFGPWDSTSMRIVGVGEHTIFGVASRNGYSEPWAYGIQPGMDLADNPALSGTATWIGTLLGFTPDVEAVAGNAQLGVDLGTMKGAADFTALESWDSGMAPGEVGSGQQWGDGDLGYAIDVRGNTFVNTGGDDGVLTGIFTGPSHEGAAGTLERSDLTAAFGASR